MQRLTLIKPKKSCKFGMKLEVQAKHFRDLFLSTSNLKNPVWALEIAHDLCPSVLSMCA